tara:strand:+ start:431 stop:1495 length:1065 start_codon:yes stop_codon:yes gene_type:complete
MSRARDFADLAGSASAGGITGRNMVINGGMTVAQRGTTFASTANVAYTLDRMQWYDTGAGVVDISQSTDTPNGNFYNSLKIDVTTADTSDNLAAGDLYNIIIQIEGYDIAHLGWGTSDAKTVTLSFHIKSPKTGTHCVTLRNSDQTRTRVEEFTVSAADTWEKKTITIPGDTSGTWQATNSAGIQLIFPLAVGSTYHSSVAAGSWGNGGNIYGSSNQVNCMDSDANNWYITGIQLEAGQTATPFEHEDFGTTLRKCQRYYNRLGFMRHQFYSSSVNSANPDLVDSITFTPMRDGPTANPYTDASYSSSGSTRSSSTTLSLGSITTTSLTATMQNSGSGAGQVKAQYYLELVSEL